MTSRSPVLVILFVCPVTLLSSQNFQEGFSPKEAWSWAALSERFGDSMVRVSLSETGRCERASTPRVFKLSVA